MPRCEICQTPFTWKQVSKSLMLGYKPIVCPHCGRLHEVQFLSRLLAAMLMAGPLYLAYFITGQETFSINVLIIIPAALLVLPYLMRYRLA